MRRKIFSTLFGTILLLAPALAGGEGAPEPVRQRARLLTEIVREAAPHRSAPGRGSSPH